MENKIEKKSLELQQNGFQLSLNEIFGTAGDIFKGIAGYAIGAFLIYLFINWLLSLILGLIFPAADPEEFVNIAESGDYTAAMDYYLEGSKSVSTGLSTLISAALSPIYLSIYTMARKFDSFKKVDFSDIFVHYRDGKFLNLFLITLIVQFLSGIGLVLCIIPGFIVYTMWILAVPFVIFANASIGEALSHSMKLAFKDFGNFSLITLSMLGISILGFILCCVGLIAAVPFLYVLIYALYKYVIGFDNDKSEIDEIGTDIYSDNPYMK